MAMKTQGGNRRAGTADPERPLVWPGDPETVTTAGIDFEALAHVLANTCLWGGRTRRFYAVAQRAVVASEAVEAFAGPGERRRLALHALLADARIAWLGDIEANGPASARAAERSRRAGAAIDRAVREAAGLDGAPTADEAELLRFVARMTAAAERRDLAAFCAGGAPGAGTGMAFPPLTGRIRPVEPGRAARLWLARYRALAAPPGAAGASGESRNPTEGNEEKDDVANLQTERATERAHGKERNDDARPLAA